MLSLMPSRIPSQELFGISSLESMEERRAFIVNYQAKDSSDGFASSVQRRTNIKSVAERSLIFRPVPNPSVKPRAIRFKYSIPLTQKKISGLPGSREHSYFLSTAAHHIAHGPFNDLAGFGPGAFRS